MPNLLSTHIANCLTTTKVRTHQSYFLATANHLEWDKYDRDEHAFIPSPQSVPKQKFVDKRMAMYIATKRLVEKARSETNGKT